MNDAEMLAETRALNHELEQLLARLPKVQEVPPSTVAVGRLRGALPAPVLFPVEVARRSPAE
jgi:hypothetical protein